eukprot:3937799-Rhodomonas_salina.1
MLCAYAYPDIAFSYAPTRMRCQQYSSVRKLRLRVADTGSPRSWLFHEKLLGVLDAPLKAESFEHNMLKRLLGGASTLDPRS